MAGAPLRPLLLLCLVLATVADVVVYEDQKLDSVPGVEAHSWTVVGDGQDGNSGFVMQLETVSASVGDGALSWDSVFGNGDANSWVTEQFQNFPFFVSAYPEDSQGQMLQNVACARFDSALTDARSRNDDSVAWGYGADAGTYQDQGWDVEVVFVPYGSDTEDADQDWLDEQFQTAQWGQSAGSEVRKYSWTTAQEQQAMSRPAEAHMLSRCLFFVLLFACALTLFVCLKQTCALRRTMKETARKAGEIAFYEGMEEDRPLLQKKGFGQGDDGYTDVMLSPIAEPAQKAVYP
eukprot:evm.model.scf_633.8 EVM.evm.TU.scf_633.8   scf_633:65811-68677(-)